MHGKRIPLVNRAGKATRFALVDEADFLDLAKLQWARAGNGYALCQVGPYAGSPILMHRLILGLAPGDGRDTDHINRDRLDNRRANLRVATHAENMQNLRGGWGASRFRGVAWDRRRNVWTAQVQLNRHKHFLGQFADEVEAAQVADAWRLEHMPFARPDPALAALTLH